MPRPRSARKRISIPTMDAGWFNSSSSSSDEDDFDFHIGLLLDVAMSMNTSGRPRKQRGRPRASPATKRATPKRAAPARKQTPAKKSKNTSIVAITDSDTTPARKNKNTSIISITESDEEIAVLDETDSKNIRENIKGKMDSFFKSGGLLSDDDEDLVSYSASTSNTNEPGCSKTKVTEEVIVIEDTTQVNTMAQEFCKETANILENANALLDKFTKTAEEKPKPATATPATPEQKSEIRSGLRECPVCYDNLNYKSIMSTKCGHLFCKECIMKVAESLKKCPMCKKPVNKKNIIPIYI